MSDPEKRLSICLVLRICSDFFSTILQVMLAKLDSRFFCFHSSLNSLNCVSGNLANGRNLTDTQFLFQIFDNQWVVCYQIVIGFNDAFRTAQLLAITTGLRQPR